MMAKWKNKILFSLVFITSFYSSNACWMQGVDIWALQVGAEVEDVYSGIILDRATENIDAIASHTFIELNRGPYLNVRLTDSRFIIETNDAFEDYEKYETELQISVTVNFRCSSGTIQPLVFVIDVKDTNNNPPEFLPDNEFVYTIHTPVAPGVLVTGCFDGIIVKDIDLTTERIDFAIEENPYFEIAYDEAASNTPKEFIGIIRTTTFIRALPEPITLTITATDVDRTGDPPRTKSANVTFIADTEFEFPEEPVFAQAFYIANYNNLNQIELNESISLRNGFDVLVQFTLEGELRNHFELVFENQNQITLRVVNPLPANVLRENQILLVIRANREYTSGDSATIVVHLPEEEPLEFDRPYNTGTIEDNVLRSPTLVITGYGGEILNFEIKGDYSSYFDVQQNAYNIHLTMTTLSEAIINENNLVLLEVIAFSEYRSASTIVALEIVKDDTVTPVFNKPLYSGSYNTETGLNLEQIVIEQGFDSTVILSLEGEHSNLFHLRNDDNSLASFTLITTGSISPEIFNEQTILLTLHATKPRTVGANTAIVITLPAARQLNFEVPFYRGTLENNVLSLENIILSTGYDETVRFDILGGFSNYFTITNDLNRITINVRTQIPDNVIQENNFIMLTIEASGLNALSTSTTVLVDIIKEDTTTPVFSRNIYYGTYQGTSAVNIENINLAQGFGNDVIFDLAGEHSQYFEITSTDNNTVVVTSRTTIPEDVIFTEKVLLFNIIARKPYTVGANAAISIRFPTELTEPAIMRFAQNTYKAEIENNILRADGIILSTGYQTNTQFVLTGDYETYFTLDSNINNGVSLSLVHPLPTDEIESNFIVLEVEARRERAISVWTSIVVDIIRQEVQHPLFTSPYYQGVYNEDTEILLFETISLAVGYDETVGFQLEGDLAPLFAFTETTTNMLTITTAGLPSEVLANNNHIIFSIVANKPNAISARAAISINIERGSTQNLALGFDQVSYVGSIHNTVVTLQPITLIKGYSPAVAFSLHGDLAHYFTISPEGAGVVRITLPAAIPDQSIPANRLIVLEIRAAAQQSLTAYATIVFEVIIEDDQSSPSPPQLAFDETYYTGSYTNAGGLILNTPIVLTEGYDQTVVFGLEEEHAQWFSVVPTGNSVTLIVSSSIPAAVLATNSQLVFVITAQRTGSETARATIVISLNDEVTEGSILGFDQVTYQGSIQSTVVTLQPITLIEGYSPAVAFSLHGDLADYFTVSPEGAGVVRITLPTAIPDQSIPANRLIVLEIRAAAQQSLTAYATIVFEVIVEDEQPSPSPPQLAFDETYYTGSYTNAGGLILNTPIVLTEGYDQTVVFGLEGEHAQWFSVVPTGNSVTLIVSSSIPAAVLATNSQLVFVITAQRTGSETARATIVISLNDEVTEGSILGFDQVTYQGSIQSTVVTLQPITLIEGYSPAVAFSLHGDLADYFTVSPEGAGVVRVTLPTAIPDQSIPANRLIVLEIRAAAQQSLTAYATIVFEVIVEDDQPSPSPPQLAFDETYYTGYYTNAGGLILNTPIVLTEGYDQTVVFGLEGEHAQWFSVVPTGNSVTLIVSSSIPAAVLATNSQLVFVITAQRTGSETARATIVISLNDEVTEGSILGFDQVTYQGSIQSTVVTLQPITLIEGYSPAVAFSLHGDLADYFTVSPEGAGVVRVTLPTAIPDQSIPANRLIVLEIRAAAQQSLTAYATIVFEVIVEDDQPSPSPPQLAFDETYYTGYYTNAGGLILNTPIVLTEGYDQTVVFGLEGEHAQWFSVVPTGNSVTLIVSSSIPAAVLATNSQLVFVITAQRTGSETARATIVISLNDEVTEGSILGFDQVTYQGSIQSTVVTLQPITLIEGYSPAVAFSLHGDLADYFTVSPEGAGVVRITLPAAIPDQSIPANRLIVLEIRADAQQSLTAYATIVFEVIVEDDQPSPSPPQLAFDETYYIGSYTNAGGLILNTPIVLTEGYEQTVVFGLEGEHAQWFSVVPTGNSVTLIVSSSIPAAVLATNSQLVFVITAQRTGSETARATIVISLNDEVTEGSILGFDQVTYQGSIQSTVVTLQPITLIEGYSPAVAFSLHGDLADYFTVSPEGAGVVRITLPAAIPDQSIPANRLIVLEIRAAAQQSLTAYATIVFEVIVEDDQPSPSPPQLAFDETYYIGSYTNAGGLILNTPIVLTEGYEQTVVFGLEREHAQWFSVVPTGNSVTLIVSSSIPAAVLATNSQLVFVITAQRTGSETARATIVISLNDEVTEGSILGFDQVTYQGSIQSTVVTLQPITLIEGYSPAVAFSLHGDLADYFTVSPEGAGVVRVTLPTAIPDQSIPANRLIVLEIRAAAQQSLTAYATIVFEVIVEDDQPSPSPPQLAFDETYYTGYYTNAGGLILNTPIVLTEGYDQTVVFGLEGEHAQWFSVVPTGNSVTLIVSSSIPAAVLATNSQLVFVITAQRTGSETARATIVISLNDEVTEGSILGFDQVTYQGSIQSTVVTLQPITLIEGYSPAVAFSLHGDLADYFTVSPEGAGVVRVTLPTAIPDQSIPANRLIVLEIRAAAQQSLTAYATIVFEVIVEDDQPSPSPPQLAFDETYYTGYYTNAGGLILNTPIVLTEGYDQTVVFGLEGEHAQWFSVVPTGNSVTLIVSSSIPAAVLATNSQLVFVITAQRTGSETARATIVISLNDEVTEGSILGFDQVTYQGSIQSTVVTLQPITLIEGYSPAVAFSLHGDLADYFTVSPEGAGVVRITLPAAIPDQSIPANRLIVLEIRADAQQSLTAYATIVFEVIVEDDQPSPSPPQLAFDETYYIGSYTNAGGLILNTPIVLTEGYEQTVVFGLEGEHAQWFSVVPTGNSVTLIVSSSIPAAVLATNSQLVFVITAQRTGSETARATIVISLNDEVTEGSILGFDQVTYQGSIQSTVVTLQPITLIEGYSPAVAFSLHGDLADYFTVSPEGAGVVRITLPAAIPDQSIPANRLIVLEIRAAAQQSLTAYATIVFEVIVEDDQPSPSPPQLAFDETYYIGSYTNAGGLILNTPIVLTEGYEQTVVFGLEGEHAQWFSVVPTGNSVTLIVSSSIPAAVLATNSQLVFVITAQRTGSETARATIVISLNDEVTEGSILGFDQVTYQGSIQSTVVTLQPITLIEGYSPAVAFSLHGDLADYFTVSPEGAGVVRVTLPTAIPDQSIPANRLIVLEIRAAAQQSLTAYATIVFEVIVEDDQPSPSPPQLAFDETYYTGYYTNAGGLILNTPIVLTEGYDQTVVFGLEGEHAQWFSVVPTGNSVTLIVSSSIPAAVLATNSQLVFVITAQRTGSETARATIVISLNDEVTEGSILGFDQVTYQGSIQSTVVTLQPITLIEGYSPAVAFSLHGDLADYFTVSPEGAGVVRVTLPTAIPDQSIPANRLIVLEIRAAAQQSLTAYATIVFEVIVEDDQPSPSPPQLAFDETYYTGYYTNAGGLILNTPIVLTEGYDQTVVFGLEGEHAQWFSVVPTGNSVTLIVSSSIPAAVLATNSQLVFVITAQRTGSETARATIVISLNDEVTEGSILGFDQVTYQGSIQSTVVTLQPITLIEGYSPAVAFSLHGDLADYFTVSPEGAGVVRITLPAAIPDQSIPANRLIVLEIRAAAQQSLTAYATIVFEVIVEDDQPSPSPPQLAFDETYYIGSYTNAGGLILNTPIVLTEGYEQTVVFGLEGEHAQWFSVVPTGNSVTLIVSSSIPAAVLATNSQLVFVITAQRTGSETARATIVISLNDEVTEGSILGFDQVTYQGSIQSTVVTLQPITLIEGYSPAVAFSLHGDLADYFTVSPEGAGVVRVTLPTAIPDQSIPANRLIVLEIRAAAQQSLTAYATIVFEVIVEDDQPSPSPPQLAFDETYYTGYYTNAGGLILNTPIVLTEGYDQTVVFGLEGEHAQWFSVVPTGNSVTLIVSSSIPAAVLATNSQLVFVITAQRTGSETARATIVISLNDEVTEGSILGFDQVTYQGSIQSTVVTLQPITLIEGYSPAVAFSLHGDLADYFTVSPEGAGVVRVTLPTAIPDQSIPANRLIVLEIRAAAQQSLTAYATIVFEVIVEDDQPSPSPPQLAFDETYYTGYYTNAGGLILNTPIVLTEGYDQTVVFGLEGEHAQWFSVVPTGNSVTLIVSSSIPAAVLATNSQLVFVITAQRTGSETARATIVISLNDEVTEGSILGFDQVTYQGSIQSTVVTLQPITLIEGYSPAVAFSLHGDLADYFTVSPEGAGVVRITLPTAIPDQSIPANRLIVLEIRAAAQQSLTAYATIVFEVIVEDDQPSPSPPQLAFDETYYTGYYTNAGGLILNTPIVLTEGYDQTVVFGLEGEHAQWFSVVPTGNSVTLIVSSSIPAAVLATNSQLVFVITAQRTGSETARATIVISLNDEVTEGSILGFDQVTYQGSIQSTVVTLQPITLIEGYSPAVAFSLHGDLADYFTVSPEGAGVVRITLPAAIPDQSIPANRLIVLEIRAAAQQSLTAYATIVFEVIVEDDQPSPSPPQLAFDETYYIGSYTNAGGLILNTPIVLTEGYDQTVVFGLEGEHAQWFSVVPTGNSVTLIVSSLIPAAVLATNSQLVFVITAQRTGSETARATMVIALTDNSQTGEDLTFDKLVYEGFIQLSAIQHESIIISNYNGVNVELHGDYSSLFVANVAEGLVTVQASGLLTLPNDVTHLALELHAADARAVLLLNVVQSDVPILPSVTFSSTSYHVNVNVVQTGLVGQVLATSDNGEAITYSLDISSEHLQARVFINNEGEMYLSAPANSGSYTFQVIATTVITQVEGTATVHLTVDAVTVCGDDDTVVVPPLIILDRDEEEPHTNLVTLNTALFEGCYFTITNRWPLDQNWLYVDDNGLHARSIDREHESIAFMALSQVQVELILHCETDNTARTKRSLRTDWLGPYDYGSNKWILTESIPYNARRTLVNLIVNDINDNAPIFVGKNLEPIVVGYPIGEIEERILPRSLAELKATDADIGENAALRYWSSEDALAVAPTTGFVHVRSGAQLQDNQRLTVSATDRNGEGLTGEIELLVKLLDLNNIAVVTVKDAFLDDEKTILAQMTSNIGYEIKTLRSVVISDDLEENLNEVSRKKRETDTAGASLLLYVYGILQSEPVVVERLITDITNNAAVATIISTVSLEDHLPVEMIYAERDIGFMVATIVLSVLLLIIIVITAIWFFLRWRKNKNYDQFTDNNSLGSRSVEDLSKPETPKPRLNIEDLKRSEKRLQDMLNLPIEEVTVEALSPRREAPTESIVDFSPPVEPNAPIVIQSIDKLKDSEDTDEDEFGEKAQPRRKSVVTFNENVEKIIHVEDDIDTISSSSDYEIYKF